MPKLFLTRELGEAVIVGGNVRVKVHAFKAPRERGGPPLIELEFQAPHNVRILREELVGPLEPGSAET